MTLRVDLLKIQLANEPKPSREAIRTVVRLKHRALYFAKPEIARRARRIKDGR